MTAAVLSQRRLEWIDPLTDPRWPTLLDRDRRASIFHTRGWLTALQRTYAYEPAAVTLSNERGELVSGLVFCRVRSWLTGRRLVSLPFSDHCDVLGGSDSNESRLLDALRNEQVDGGWRYVEVRSRGPRCLPEGFGESRSFYLHRIDLTKHHDELVRGLHRNHILRKIRRSEREGLTYEAGRSDALLNAFYALLLLTRRRHCLPPQPPAWFRTLLDCLPDEARIHVAFRSRAPVAAIVTLRHRDVTMYKYGASDASFHNLGSVQMLLWRAIQDSRDAGCTVFDLGRSAVENVGEIAFKEHWGAERHALQYLRSPRPRSAHRTTPAGRFARRLFSMAPDAALVAVGKGFYRHVG